MKKSTLFVAMLCAASIGCTVPSPIQTSGNPDLGTNPAPSKKITAKEASKFLSAMRSIQSATGSAENRLSHFSHKGMKGFRHIDQYSDNELKNCSQNELTGLLTNALEADLAVSELNAMGYEASHGSSTLVVVKLPSSGPSALRKHFKVLDGYERFKIVAPRVAMVPHTWVPMPNDPAANTGTPVHQWPVDRVNAREAWSYPAIANSQAVVAVLDSGVSTHQSDITPRLIQGVDSTPTWQFIKNWGNDTDDYYGHGTAVAGIVAAVTGNGNGMAGMAQNGRIMPIAVGEPRVTSEWSSTPPTYWDDNAWAGVYYAVDHGARVINCSFGAPYNASAWMWDACNYAHDHGAVLVCSVGNSGENSWAGISYPAAFSFDFDNVLGIGATDFDNNRCGFSESGTGISFCAPGDYQPYLPIHEQPLPNYAHDRRGTSFAAPIVSGALASLWTACSALPYQQIISTLEVTASHNGQWNDQYTGWGTMNFGAAADFLLGSGVVYRWDSSGSELHGWTNNPAETMGNIYEGLAFGLRTSQQSGTIPLYRKYCPSNGDRLLTTDINEASWFNNEGVIGYVSTSSGANPGMLNPIYRFCSVSSPFQGHLFTENQGEANSLMNNPNWKFEAIIGYAW